MKKRILLVDDSSTVLMMERMILEKSSYQTITARDGAEAVEKAVNERPDAILMDMMMPRMNGLQACSELRRHENTRHIPIIMVTTRGEALNVEAGFANGCSDYVTKPIDSVELLTKLRNALGQEE